MRTIRIGGDIFNAEYILRVTEAKNDSSTNIDINIFVNDLMSIIKGEDIDIIDAIMSKNIVQTSFKVELINGKSYTKRYSLRDLDKSLIRIAFDLVEEIYKEFNFDKLISIKKEKSRLASELKYEQAAKERDKEKKLIETLDFKELDKSIKTNVFENILFAHLLTMAEADRCRIEKLIQDTDSPIVI